MPGTMRDPCDPTDGATAAPVADNVVALPGHAMLPRQGRDQRRRQELLLLLLLGALLLLLVGGGD